MRLQPVIGAPFGVILPVAQGKGKRPFRTSVPAIISPRVSRVQRHTASLIAHECGGHPRSTQVPGIGL